MCARARAPVASCLHAGYNVFFGGSFCNMIADGPCRCSAVDNVNVSLAIWDRFRFVCVGICVSQ